MSAASDLRRAPELVPVALASAVAWAVARTWWQRVGYPFDLEWMEGGMLAHSWRLLHGLPLYPEAGPDWMPYVYPPGYAAVVSALGSAFGLGYPVGRFVSVVGTVAATSAAAFAVARSGAGWACGLAAAGVFLGSYELSGAFYDLVRPDGLAMALLGWAIAVGLERWRRAPEIAGVLLVLAFLVKHHTAAYGAPIAFGLWARDGWRSAGRFAAWSAVPAGLYTLSTEIATDGRFLRWLLAVPASHPIVWDRIFPGAFEETASLLLPACLGAAGILFARTSGVGRLLAAAGGLAGGGAVVAVGLPTGVIESPLWAAALCAAAVGAGAGAAIGRIARWDPWWEWVYGAGIGSCAWVTAAVMRGHNGGFLNVWIPLHWAIAVAFGVGMGRARDAFGGALAATTLCAGVVAAQLGWEEWKLDLERLVPRAEDVAAGESVLASVRENCDGPILSPIDPWLAVQAGQAPSWHLITLWDVDHPGGPFAASVSVIEAAIRDHRWACVVDGDNSRLGVRLGDAYRIADSPRLPARVFNPKTGWRVRPSRIWVPK